MHETDSGSALSPGPAGRLWVGICSGIFRSLQSHILPVDPVNINGYTDRRADNGLREENIYLIGSRGRVVKFALSYIVICFWRVT